VFCVFSIPQRAHPDENVAVKRRIRGRPGFFSTGIRPFNYFLTTYIIPLSYHVLLMLPCSTAFYLLDLAKKHLTQQLTPPPLTQLAMSAVPELSSVWSAVAEPRAFVVEATLSAGLRDEISKYVAKIDGGQRTLGAVDGKIVVKTSAAIMDMTVRVEEFIVGVLRRHDGHPWRGVAVSEGMMWAVTKFIVADRSSHRLLSRRVEGETATRGGALHDAAAATYVAFCSLVPAGETRPSLAQWGERLRQLVDEHRGALAARQQAYHARRASLSLRLARLESLAAASAPSSASAPSAASTAPPSPAPSPASASSSTSVAAARGKRPRLQTT
jgi:hypothetical protein